MAAGRFTNLIFLLSFPAAAVSIKDGEQVAQCDYPGVVAVTLPEEGTILCNGVRSEGILYLPELCGYGIDYALSSSDVNMFYGDGSRLLTFPAGSEGTFNNDLYELTIPEAMEEDCNPQATFYKGDDLDMGSCQVVGYGGQELSAKVYDGALNAVNLTRSTSAPCCKAILDSLTESERGLILNADTPLNCVTSPGSACGIGDLGAPVYCKNSAGDRVVMGLSASTPCENGGTFLIRDLTDSDPNFKFGIGN